MILILTGGIVAAVFLVVALALRLSRPHGSSPAGVTGPWPRTRDLDVVEFDWSSPADRKRLGKLGQ